MRKRKPWPKCGDVKVLRGLRMLDSTYDRTLTCEKPALHLGKHHDYGSMFTWRNETWWERLA